MKVVIQSFKCVAVAVVAFLMATVTYADHLPPMTDVGILNFALNLECLEAEFYSWAAFGYGLKPAESGVNGPISVGGQKAKLSAYAQMYAEEIAIDEIAHVRFLRQALGSSAVPCPQIDIGPAFVAAANAAFNTTLPVPFDAYANDVLFYHAAFVFEDVGVTAYKGAAPLIADKAILEAAAGILAVEAYHAGTIRTLLAEIADQFVFPYNVTVGTIVQAISDLRDSADGPTDLDQGILSGKGANATLNIVPTDANSLTFSRTVEQVLRIVYLGGTRSGGFFPQGIRF